MIDQIKCPECKKEMKILPQREPLPESGSISWMNTMATTFTGPSYSATLKTFKCSNPECWVTKLSLSWS